MTGTCVCAHASQVYTVGPDYAHAEARKSPALDGKVERDSEGKEIRYPVMLTSMEKLVARKVCMAFKVRSVPMFRVFSSTKNQEQILTDRHVCCKMFLLLHKTVLGFISCSVSLH